MARLGLVETGEQAAHDRRRPLRPEDQRRPAGGRVHPAAGSRRLERADHGGAHCDDPATGRQGAVDQPGGHRGDREPLRLRRLVRLLAGHAGVQHDRHHRHAAGHQPDQRALGQRTPGARHLGAAGPVGVHVLQGVQRPGRRRRTGSGSAGRARSGSRRRSTAGSGTARQSRRLPGRVRRSPPAAGRRPASRSTSPGSPARPARRRRRAAARPPRTPSSSWVETCSVPGAAAPLELHRRGQGRAGVDHQQVAGVEQVGQRVGPQVPGARRA